MFSGFVDRPLGPLLAVCLLLAACGGGELAPEDRVRGVIEAMEAAVEAGSMQQAAALLDSQYKDRWHANRPMAIRSLLGFTRRHSNIHLFTVIKTVDVVPQGDAASALVYVAMTGIPVESIETLISLKADLYRFDVRLTKADGEWRIIGSEWERVDPGSL